jgi:spore maturation protein CgeB
MKLVIFGLTVSSSWGNGHATLWRGLIRALSKRGHAVVFFEKDVPYYASHRDLAQMSEAELVLYRDWEDNLPKAHGHLADADVAMVTSDCPDGIAASELVLSSDCSVRVFYDLDTPATLNSLRNGKQLSYIGSSGLRDFDLVLSYTGGGALHELRRVLGAQRVAPLYGSVDPRTHYPVRPAEAYQAHFSYLGTYAEDRQAALEKLFIEPARRLPNKKFLIGGAQYPDKFPWAPNIYFARHVAPAEHPEFYCSSAITLNVTRGVMAEKGYCPSGRLFEAAACGVPILSDYWEGLDQFFEPGKEILIAQNAEDSVAALNLPAQELAQIAASARERVLAEHTSEKRAEDFERAVQHTCGSKQAVPQEGNSDSTIIPVFQQSIS